MTARWRWECLATLHNLYVQFSKNKLDIELKYYNITTERKLLKTRLLTDKGSIAWSFLKISRIFFVTSYLFINLFIYLCKPRNFFIDNPAFHKFLFAQFICESLHTYTERIPIL